MYPVILYPCSVGSGPAGAKIWGPHLLATGRAPWEPPSVLEIPMSSLSLEPFAVLSDPSPPIPPGVELVPAGLPEWLDPFSAEFPDHSPDESPELPDVLPFEPDEADEGWWAEQTRDGGWVEGESTPFDVELHTASALQHFNEHLDPGPEPEPSATEYCLF
jgi:hypothetical protein